MDDRQSDALAAVRNTNASRGSRIQAAVVARRALAAWRPRSSHCAGEATLVCVCYRWHPLHGQVVRVLRRQPGVMGVQLFYEFAGGIRSAIPEWMTDAGRCAAMTCGKPVVCLAALVELKRLLEARDSSPGAPGCGSMGLKEVHDAKRPAVPTEPVGSTTMRGRTENRSKRGATPAAGTAAGRALAQGGKTRSGQRRPG